MATYTELMRGFEFGPWTVLPERGLIRDGEHEHKIEPLVMDVFVVLASHGGDVVTKDQLIEQVWDGRPQMDDVITRCISALRRGLQDDARAPKYIETVQRRGYRVMLPVSLLETAAAAAEPAAESASMRPYLLLISVGFLAVIAIAWFAFRDGSDDRGPVDDIASVAVFPFECRQDSRATDEHLCFGFAEEAITSLKRISNMKVVRIRQPYNSNLAVTQNSVVTGSVQIIADKVKIAAQLEDARSGVVIWSDTFDADRNSVFDLQRRVATALRRAMDVEPGGQGGSRREPSSFAAADAYALGRYLFQKRDHQSTVDAIAQFEEAIRLDPSYGPAYLGLASTYIIWPDYDLSVDRESTYNRALQVVDAGVAADPGIREAAGTVYGFIYHKRNNWIDAVAATGMAVNAPAAGADDYNWHSRVLASVGRMQEALDYARKGLELDPEYPVIVSRVAITYFWLDDLANAERYFAIANRMDLEASIHSLAYSLFLIRSGRFEEAKAYAIAGLQKNNVDTRWVEPVFGGIASSADRPAAIAILDQLSSQHALPENVEMTLWQLLGETDRSMAVARRLESSGGLFETEIIFIDQFKSFRQHPDFGQFVAGIGLSDYWASAGCNWVNDRLECRQAR